MLNKELKAFFFLLSVNTISKLALCYNSFICFKKQKKYNFKRNIDILNA